MRYSHVLEATHFKYDAKICVEELKDCACLAPAHVWVETCWEDSEILNRNYLLRFGMYNFLTFNSLDLCCS